MRSNRCRLGLFLGLLAVGGRIDRQQLFLVRLGLEAERATGGERRDHLVAGFLGLLDDGDGLLNRPRCARGAGR